MSLTQAIHSGATAAPAQFSGDLIELAILFLVLAILAALAGAGGVAGLSMSIAKWLVILFIALAVLTFLF